MGDDVTRYTPPLIGLPTVSRNCHGRQLVASTANYPQEKETIGLVTCCIVMTNQDLYKYK